MQLFSWRLGLGPGDQTSAEQGKATESFETVSIMSLRQEGEGGICLKEKYIASVIFMVCLVLTDKNQNDVTNSLFLIKQA